MMEEDRELIRQFAEEESQVAFEALAARHLDLVYSVALRQAAGDIHLAQDACQDVFAALARKANRLKNHQVISAWLYVAAKFAAGRLVRAENTRRRKEREASEMGESREKLDSVVDWSEARSLIDEAIAKLKDSERNAIFLRFFENKQFTHIGEHLGVSENTARMRVNRALDKLHGFLLARGVRSTAASIAAALGGQAASSSPVGLLQLVSSTSLAGFGVGGVSFITNLISFMNTTKVIVSLSVIGSAVLVGTAIILTGKATSDHPSLDQNVDHAEKMQRVVASTEIPLPTPSEVDVDSPDSELESLKRQLLEAKVELERLSRPFGEHITSSTVRAVVREGETLVTGGYLTQDGNYEFTFFTPESRSLANGSEGIRSSLRIISVGAGFVSDTGLESLATNARNTLQHAEAWPEYDARATLGLVKDYDSAQVLSGPTVTSRSGSEFTVIVRNPEGSEGSTYTLRAKVEKNADGNYVVESHIVRPDTEMAP